MQTRFFLPQFLNRFRIAFDYCHNVSYHFWSVWHCFLILSDCFLVVVIIIIISFVVVGMVVFMVVIVVICVVLVDVFGHAVIGLLAVHVQGAEQHPVLGFGAGTRGLKIRLPSDVGDARPGESRQEEGEHQAHHPHLTSRRRQGGGGLALFSRFFLGKFGGE